jgi:SAM-dependent methyltransferase
MAAQLRDTFDQVALLYDEARPRYPPALVEELVALAGLPPAADVLEIGCGTGQLTVPLADWGCRIHCVELGPNLAAVARKNLAAFPQVQVTTGAFETWDPGPRTFDLVASATAWHWLDPAIRLGKAWAVLRPAGSLAVVQTHHVQPVGGDPFFAGIQEVYVRLGLSDQRDGPAPPEAIPDDGAEVESSGLFEPPAFRRYLWSCTYTADQYIAVLETYSPNRLLAPATRDELYGDIRRRIAQRPDGTITKHYLFTLTVARKR